MSAMHVADAIDDYVVALVCATRRAGEYDADLGPLDRGRRQPARHHRPGPRGARPGLAGRAGPCGAGDVRDMAQDVLRHRLILSYEANADRVTPDAVIASAPLPRRGGLRWAPVATGIAPDLPR
jgi:MoxR-like ATPase